MVASLQPCPIGRSSVRVTRAQGQAPDPVRVRAGALVEPQRRSGLPGGRGGAVGRSAAGSALAKSKGGGRPPLSKLHMMWQRSRKKRGAMPLFLKDLQGTSNWKDT